MSVLHPRHQIPISSKYGILAYMGTKQCALGANSVRLQCPMGSILRHNSYYSACPDSRTTQPADGDHSRQLDGPRGRYKNSCFMVIWSFRCRSRRCCFWLLSTSRCTLANLAMKMSHSAIYSSVASWGVASTALGNDYRAASRWHPS